jgi:hypothetical protein
MCDWKYDRSPIEPPALIPFLAKRACCFDQNKATVDHAGTSIVATNEKACCRKKKIKKKSRETMSHLRQQPTLDEVHVKTGRPPAAAGTRRPPK